MSTARRTGLNAVPYTPTANVGASLTTARHSTGNCLRAFWGLLEPDAATVEKSLARSLRERLFEARVELVAALDKLDGGHGAPVGDDVDGTQSESALRAETAQHLNKIVRGMNIDNFVVRPARRWVENYSDEAAWAHLDPGEGRRSRLPPGRAAQR
jgi:hypothetical protein